MPDHLTQEEFDSHVEKRTLRLAFVGMSNAGKSHRARVLAEELGFTCYDVDGEILGALGFTNAEEPLNRKIE